MPGSGTHTPLGCPTADEVWGAPPRRRVPVVLDRDLVLALAWCGATPNGRPADERAYEQALELGLLAHDPVWRATERGIGALIALGLLPGEPAPDRSHLTVLWARQPRADAPAQFVRAWTDGFVEHYEESFRHELDEAKQRWREWPGAGEDWVFFTTQTELERP